MYDRFLSKFPSNIVSRNEPLAKHTSFQIGGPADLFLTPNTPQEFQELISEIKKDNLRYLVIGGGNNLLFSDKGFRGLIISTTKLNRIDQKDNILQVLCGTSLKELTEYCQQASLSGLEFACGIPGSVGGAVFMNAGAYGGEMKDVITDVIFLDVNNQFQTYSASKHNFAYRNSIYQLKGLHVIQANFVLKHDNPDRIRLLMDELQAKRKAKQPLEYPSAGSVFRRPQGYFVGKLIDDAGLRGFAIGDAQISDKHSGFIINKGCARADDVLALIKHIQQIVECKFGVKLHPELRIIDY